MGISEVWLSCQLESTYNCTEYFRCLHSKVHDILAFYQRMHWRAAAAKWVALFAYLDEEENSIH